MSESNCIYCLKPASVSGEGDHVIPDAFGRFEGQFIFRRICRDCNSRIGRCEEQLIRCAPEALMRRLAQAGPSRDYRGSSWVGAGGMPPPRFFVNRGDHLELAQPSADDPLTAEAIDQLVIVDKSNKQHEIRLFPQMNAAALRTKVDALQLDGWLTINLRADQANCSHYISLVKEVWPNMPIVEASEEQPGTHRVPMRIGFSVNADYWRAIAKIAFHYYLVTTSRGFSGHEPMFAGIRSFIIEGSDHQEFFVKPIRIAPPPFRELSEDQALLPKDWLHVLAADDSEDIALAMVSLFMGPERIARTDYIQLARLPTPLVLPNARCAHVYKYGQENPNYSGRVFEVSLSRLQ
jgi:hypothetical protein